MDKEALAITFALERFRLYLYGRRFTILTDHKPLQYILGPKTAIPTLAAQRLQRWAVVLSAFDYDLWHIRGTENSVADALSRLPLSTTCSDHADAVYNISTLKLDNMPVIARDIAAATKGNTVLLSGVAAREEWLARRGG